MMKMKGRRDGIQQIGERTDLYEKQDNQSKLIGREYRAIYGTTPGGG